MSEPPKSLRRYDESEISRLLERTAELQRSTPASPSPSGLTLGELEEIAAEAGLDVTHLQRAARELEFGGSSEGGGGIGQTLAGAPTRIVIERILPFEAPESAFARVVPLIQIAAENPGTASQVGKTMTWQSQNPSNPRTLQILIAVRSGETLVRIEERYGGLAGALYGGIMGGGSGLAVGGGGLIGGLAGSTALMVGLPIAMFGGAYLIARKIYTSIVGRRTQALERLAVSLAEELADIPQLPPGNGLP